MGRRNKQKALDSWHCLNYTTINPTLTGMPDNIPEISHSNQIALAAHIGKMLNDQNSCFKNLTTFPEPNKTVSAIPCPTFPSERKDTGF
jgi:hypothetical protein